MSICNFCPLELTGDDERPAMRRKEHVIPEWLLERQGIRDEVISPTHYSFAGTGADLAVSVRSARKHTLNGLLAGHVCKTCNEGWMSQLETEVKPILGDLIDEKRYIASLETAERFAVARWVAKTAYALNRASNFPNIVPREHLESVRTDLDGLAENVIVMAGKSDHETGFTWSQSPSWIVYADDEDDIEPLLKKSYKIGFQFGRLILMAAWWPGYGKYMFTPSFHHPVWPRFQPAVLSISSSPHSDFPSVFHQLQYFIGTFAVLLRPVEDGAQVEPPLKTLHFKLNYEDYSE